MSFLHLNFYSHRLKYQTDLNVVIPTPDGDDEKLGLSASDYFSSGRRYQVLYLLHGTAGDCYDWLHKTNVERLAQQHRLALVMPSCQNSFFLNMASGPAYLDFLTTELPDFITTLLPISKKRENTFIAGLSMGGYGAWRVALSAPERFAAAASLSGVLDFPKNSIMEDKIRHADSEIWPFRAILGDRDPDELAKDESIDLLRRLQALAGAELPRLMITVGTDDFTYESNQKVRAALARMNIPCNYTEGPGIHDWFYWGEHIKDVLDWLPLTNDTGRE